MTPDEYVSLANVLIKDGCYKEALKKLDEALTLDPLHARALRRKGKALLKLKQYKKAIRFLEASNKLEPKARVCTEISDCYLRIDKPNQALDWVDKALELDQNYAWARERKGRILRELGDFEAAIIELNKSLDLKKEAWTFSELGEVYRCKGCKNKENRSLRIQCYGDALREQERAIELNPKMWRALERKGRVLRLLNNCEDAKKANKSSLKINPDNVIAIRELGESYSKCGDRGKARKAKQKSHHKNPKKIEDYKRRLCD